VIDFSKITSLKKITIQNTEQKSQKRTMYEPRCCQQLDAKSRARSHERYIARVGIFKTEALMQKIIAIPRIGIGSVTSKKITYTSKHSNNISIYRCNYDTLDHRVQILCLNYAITIFVDSSRQERPPTISPKYDSDRIPYSAYPYVFQCWKSYSKFAVYGEDSQCCQTVDNMQSSRRVHGDISDCISYVTLNRDPRKTLRPCLILPWFDRIGRMIFCNYLKSLFQSEVRSCVPFVVFVCQYL
jgi:hypothetical protein